MELNLFPVVAKILMESFEAVALQSLFYKLKCGYRGYDNCVDPKHGITLSLLRTFQ